MPTEANPVLITSAATINVVADGGVATDYYGTDAADAFLIADGAVGDDTFYNFQSNDSIITTKKIYDGNGDGLIAFGPNGVLDVDRTSSKKPGDDQVSVMGAGGEALTLLRHLGGKDGQHAYANAATLLNLEDANAGSSVIEGDVTNDTFSAANGSTVFLYDNALGLNLGGDTISGFGLDDALVTTSALYNGDGSVDGMGRDTIHLGKNDILDLSGAQGPLPSDPSANPGGQISFNADLTLVLLDTVTDGDVTYYYYGREGSTFDVPGMDV